MSDAHVNPVGTHRILRDRWSPSIFDPGHELGDDELRTLLQAAQWAPSLGNTQPWGLVVLRRGSAGHAALVEHLPRGNAGWVPRASVVLLMTTYVGDADRRDWGWYDAGQAAAHVTLQAVAMGLHAHQFAGMDRAAVASALGVPEDRVVTSGIAIGRHAPDSTDDERLLEREQRPRHRHPLAEIAHVGRWGEPFGGSRDTVDP